MAMDRRVPTMSSGPIGPVIPYPRLTPQQRKYERLSEERLAREAKLRENLLTLIVDDAKTFTNFMNDRDVQCESSLVRQKQPRKRTRFFGIPYGENFIEQEEAYWVIRDIGVRRYEETDYAAQRRERTEDAYQQLVIGNDGKIKIIHSIGNWTLSSYSGKSPFIRTAAMEDVFYRPVVTSAQEQTAVYDQWRYDLGQACLHYAGVSPANLFPDATNNTQVGFVERWKEWLSNAPIRK